jgi:hypothetical protein
MRTSHKHTHTPSPASRLGRRSVWVRLLVLTVLLGCVAVGVIRWGANTAQANELEAARLQLEKAQAEFRTNPTKDTGVAVQSAMLTYRKALGIVPAGPARPADVPVELNVAAFAVSPAARDIAPPPVPDNADKFGNKRKNEGNVLPIRSYVPNHPGTEDNGAKQTTITPGPNLVSAPIQNFAGLEADDLPAIFGSRVAPPDTVADVGPNHVVEMVNSLFRVYDKTGTPLTAVAPLSTIWASLGAPFNDIDDGNDGDPIVLYDPLADRWMLSQFEIVTVAGAGRAQAFQLMAISQTGDPTGAYFLYAFAVPPGRINDYPHFGVWPDAYYMTDNGFNSAFTAFLGGGCYAFNRAKMLVGDPTANGVFFNLPDSGGMLPTDIDGVAAPPAGAPNLFFEFLADEFGSPADSLNIFEFRPDFNTPANSTLTQRPALPLAAFDARQPSSRAVVAQPAGGEGLDAIADRLMHRVAYRSLPGGAQSYVLNFTVNVSGVNPTNSATYQGGVRWTELRRDTGTGAVTVNQQSTYAPGAVDGANGRDLWMASIAQDGEGNIGLVANASQLNPALNPTAVYTGRLSADAANTLTQGEVDALAAITRGVQTGTSNRWGDYSSLSVDPADECTFWAAMEYVDAPTATFDWNTRIFSFKVNPACVAPAKGSIAGQATTLVGGAPIPDVTVTVPGGFFRATDATGNYTFTSAAPANTLGLAPGTYTVSCSKAGFTTVSGSVVVTGGATATFNCAMTGMPVLGNGGSNVATESCNTDNRFDPGEDITINLCVANTGGGATSNLVGTLQATGGVTAPSSAQSFGAVAPGATVCRTFTFKVNPAQACGTNVVLTLALQDGANNYGNLTYTFASGQPIISFAENFDTNLVTPGLPAGWVAANDVGPAPLWVTVTGNSDSPANHAFIDNPAVLSDKTLTTPAIPIASAAAELTFRHAFSLESGFDGGVLEVSIDNAAFVDVTSGTAGGTFTAGGYTGTISTSFSSPIGGRSAWTGFTTGGSTTLIGGYITSTVRFGAALQGKSVKFRWRMASDTTVSRPGWRVDSIQVTGGVQCCLPGPVPVVKIADPAVCNGPGGVVTGTVTAANPAPVPRDGTITVNLPTTPFSLLGIAGSCVANIGTCVVGVNTVTWTGTIPANGNLSFSYQAQISDNAAASATATITTVGSFTGSNPLTVLAPVRITCQPVGPGALPGTANNPTSDQRAGSVLFYNIYTSTVGSTTQDTRISITNTDMNRISYVHLFFVDGSTCSVADAYICLTPNQTASFLASDLDPGTSGYIVAVATDRGGCPINFNYLIGDEYVKFTSGHQANLAAESILAIAGGLTACNPGSVTATLNFDGLSYGVLPRVLALSNVGSRADGNDTLMIVNSVGGDLRAFAQTLRPLFGILYDDAESGASFTFAPGTCQFRGTVNNNFPKTTPRFDTVVPAGRSAWMKFWVNSGSASAIEPILGAAINRNPNAAATSGAFNQGHNLHKLNTTPNGTLTIPVLPATCQ